MHSFVADPRIARFYKLAFVMLYSLVNVNVNLHDETNKRVNVAFVVAVVFLCSATNRFTMSMSFVTKKLDLNHVGNLTLSDPEPPFGLSHIRKKNPFQTLPCKTFLKLCSGCVLLQKKFCLLTSDMPGHYAVTVKVKELVSHSFLLMESLFF